MSLLSDSNRFEDLHGAAIGTSQRAGQSLHSLSPATNPYKMMLEVVGSTLAPFDPDCQIQLYGYGDFVSQDKSLVTFDSQAAPFDTVDNALAAYEEVIRKVHMSGPPNFAPAIYQAMQLVEASGGRMHVLVILACSSMAAQHEQASRQAVVAASACALHIVVVALGDGPSA